jgi:formate dehydrogenase maturation protein FdhE
MAADTPPPTSPRRGELRTAFAESKKLFSWRAKQLIDCAEHGELADCPRSFTAIARVRAALSSCLPAPVTPLPGAVASALADRPSAARQARYCVCATLAAQWNALQLGCALRGCIPGVVHRHVEDPAGGVDAETRGACHSYVKIVVPTEHSALDLVADDAASLDLDMMLRDVGWRHGGVEPFPAGY